MRADVINLHPSPLGLALAFGLNLWTESEGIGCRLITTGTSPPSSIHIEGLSPIVRKVYYITASALILAVESYNFAIISAVYSWISRPILSTQISVVDSNIIKTNIMSAL